MNNRGRYLRLGGIVVAIPIQFGVVVMAAANEPSFQGSGGYFISDRRRITGLIFLRHCMH